MDVLLVGSIAYDSVTSPAGKVERALGGSATYGGLASSFHAKRLGIGTVGLVGVVGKDFTEGDRSILCLLYTSPSPRDQRGSRMPSSA